jgi:hypothetical protein
MIGPAADWRPRLRIVPHQPVKRGVLPGLVGFFRLCFVALAVVFLFLVHVIAGLALASWLFPSGGARVDGFIAAVVAGLPIVLGAVLLVGWRDRVYQARVQRLLDEPSSRPIEVLFRAAATASPEFSPVDVPLEPVRGPDIGSTRRRPLRRDRLRRDGPRL